jgi:hypothetical protein
MLVEGRILSQDGQPIPGAVIDTWEADGHGPYYCNFTLMDSFTLYGHPQVNMMFRTPSRRQSIVELGCTPIRMANTSSVLSSHPLMAFQAMLAWFTIEMRPLMLLFHRDLSVTYSSI